MLEFSPANAKIKNLAKVRSLKKYLRNKRKVYSLDLLSGHSCPFAEECLSKAMEREDGSRYIQDGKNTIFRCFSASQEALFPGVYNRRKNNLDYLVGLIRNGISPLQLSILISEQLPKDLGILRVHVGGDFFNQKYFDAMLLTAAANHDKLFYAYTKSLKYWANQLSVIPDNFVLTASRGGRHDYLIDEHNLREAVVIADSQLCEKIAKQGQHNRINKHGSQFDGMPIDHDDSHAANPKKRNESFALLIHGSQPAGSDASKAKSNLGGVGSYGSK